MLSTPATGVRKLTTTFFLLAGMSTPPNSSPVKRAPSRLGQESPLSKRPRLSSPTPNESEGQPPTVLEATPTQSENQRKYHIITTSIYVLILVLFFR